MGRFSELGQNVKFVTEELLKDADLLKLLTYNSSTPLSQLNVNNPKSLLFNKIYPVYKIPTVEEKEKSILTYVFSNAKLTDNVKFKEYKLIFNIICHIDLWTIKDSIRPYEIAERIDNIFNEKRGTQLSIGKVIFEDFIYREYNSKFAGFYLCYKLVDFN